MSSRTYVKDELEEDVTKGTMATVHALIYMRSNQHLSQSSGREVEGRV